MNSNPLGFRIWDPGDLDHSIKLSLVVSKDNSRYSTKHEVKKEGNMGHCTMGATKTSCMPIYRSMAAEGSIMYTLDLYYQILSQISKTLFRSYAGLTWVSQ